MKVPPKLPTQLIKSNTMTTGYSLNNPTNIERGSFTYTGEIPNSGRFRAFSSMAYGIRAWIKNLMFQKNVRGRKTYFDYLSTFAPVGDGNSPLYPSRVVGADFGLYDDIRTDYDSVKTLFYNQARNEINAAEADSIPESTFAEAWQLYQGGTDATIYTITNSMPGNTAAVGILVLFITGLLFIFFIANTKRK